MAVSQIWLKWWVPGHPQLYSETLLDQNEVNWWKEGRKGKKKPSIAHWGWGEVRPKPKALGAKWKWGKFHFSQICILSILLQDSMCFLVVRVCADVRVLVCTCVHVCVALIQRCRGKGLELLLRSCQEVEFLSPSFSLPWPLQPQRSYVTAAMWLSNRAAYGRLDGSIVYWIFLNGALCPLLIRTSSQENCKWKKVPG